MYASYRNNISIVNRLIELGADINAQDKYGKTALMCASMYDNLDIINRLIELGLDINAQDKYGKTALMYASENNRFETVKRLIELGANVNIQNKDGKIALMYALKRESICGDGGANSNIINILVKANSDINIIDNNCYNASLYAVQTSKIYGSNCLNEYNLKIDINARTTCNAYLYATITNDKNIIKFFNHKGLTFEHALNNVDFDNGRFKQGIHKALLKKGFPINIDDISNENKEFVLNIVRIALTDFGKKLASPYHGINIPMKELVKFGISIEGYGSSQEEQNILDAIADRFDNVIANRSQEKIDDIINDLFKLCETNNDIFSIVNAVIDVNVVRRDDGSSLTKLLNFYKFDTREFNVKLKTIQKFKEVYANNTKMNDGSEISIINKFFKLLRVSQLWDRLEPLSQNLDINKACLLYQRWKTDGNKRYLLNIIVNNMDDEIKESILEDLEGFKIPVDKKMHKYVSLETSINVMMDNEFGTCLKNKLQAELNMDNEEQEEIEGTNEDDLNNFINANNGFENNIEDENEEEWEEDDDEDYISLDTYMEADYEANSESEIEENLDALINANNDLNNNQNQLQ